MFVTEKLISFIAPHFCIGCGYEGRIVCEWCLPDIAPPIPEICYRCQKQSDDYAVCASCRRQSRLKHVWVKTDYDETAKRLVHDFKFTRKQSAAVPIAKLMEGVLPFLPENTIVTHVPTASSRVRIRGYDQAKLLAKEIADIRGLEHITLLRRYGNSRQVGAKRKERTVQLKDAFNAASGPPGNRPILLVDDLVTTGSTLEAAASTLKSAGCKTVNAVVFARKS